jgi:hypothetical protein
MDMDKVSSVLEMYARHCGLHTSAAVNTKTLGRKARSFLFSDESLFEEKQLKELVNWIDGKARLDWAAFDPKSFPYSSIVSTERDIYAHCRAMLPKMQVFLSEGRNDKCLRWVGFIWGCCVFFEESFSSDFDKKIALVLEYRSYFTQENRLDLAHAFLGIIQGLLWSGGTFTLTAFMDHSRP